MNTAKQLPILYQADTVILGGSTQAVEAALHCAQNGAKTVLIAQSSFLGTEICMTADYPEGFVPDNYKIMLEEKCAAQGVVLLYQCHFVDSLRGDRGEQIVRLAGKFGLACVIAETVTDLRLSFRDRTYHALLSRRDDPKQVKVMSVDVPAEPDPAARMLAARQRILDTYRKEYAGGDYLLGRFAIRGGKTELRTARMESGSSAVHEILAHAGEVMENLYETLECSPVFCGTEENYDVVVVGGGTAGAMAAIAAARRGMRTVIIEPNYALGGTSTVGGVSAYWFGNRYSDISWVDRRVGEINDSLQLGKRSGLWGETDYWNPDIKATVLLEAALDANVTVCFDHMAFGVWKERNAVAGVAAIGPEGVRFFRGSFLLDATGDGDIAVFAGADWEYGTGSDQLSYWASLAQYPTAATYQNNFSAMMVTCDPVDYTRFAVTARHFGSDLYDHGSYACVRESRHIRGEYRLTLRDLMTHPHHPDTLYTCYSNYDPKGKVTADTVYCGILPQQNLIEIPFSCLLPVDRQGQNIEHLYVLGKAISASHDVFPSIRMQADLMHQGSILGSLIAVCAAGGQRPEEVSNEERRKILLTLSDDPLTSPLSGEMTLEQSVSALNSRSRRHWVDMDFTDRETVFQPSAAVYCADSSAVVPLLEAKLAETTNTDDRRPLIRCQLWHGCSSHLEEYLGMLAQDLEGKTLPERAGACTCAQLLPDHGVMPEIVYDMNILAWIKGDISAPFCRVFELLTVQLRDYHSLTAGIFPYVESFAYVGARNGDPQVLELAERLTYLPELEQAESMPDSDLMKQRFLMLRYLLWRSLAEQGRRAGYAGLIRCLESPVLPIALSAKSLLTRLTGCKWGRDTVQWTAWLEDHADVLPVCPIQEKVF